MCQFATKDIAEDLGISMRVCWESTAAVNTIFVEDSQTAKVLKLGIVIVCKAEGMVSVQPAMVCVTSIGAATRDNFSVRECFRHCVFDCVDCAHGGL